MGRVAAKSAVRLLSGRTAKSRADLCEGPQGGPHCPSIREHGKRQGRPAQGRKVRPIKNPRYEITARQGGSETICCKTTSDALSATERPAFP